MTEITRLGEPEVVETDNFDLICFLVLKGMKIKFMRRHPDSTKENRRAIAIFDSTEEIDRLIQVHQMGDIADPELMVNIREYQETKERVKKIINFNLGKYNKRYEKDIK